MIEAGLIPPPAPIPPLKKDLSNARDSVTSLGSRTTSKALVFDEEDEAVRSRLESIGLHVGANFAERLCRDRPLFSETLDAIKFICKDIWVACWDKQVDNLRTNHRSLKRAKLYVAMPAGIIKGALSRLGFHGTVTPEISSLPQCTFQVKLPKNV
ncbi:NO signaling/Golgi transport ligand-binding domain-containing protein [Infundibulicybe gibba]|nr:NO signaling/Golgi transport ligand-binding domain-containing protein [Infundibulicybe gibba]